MAIKRGSKVETSFGSASMTDLMFLLLVFLMVATTLINNNGLDILLPQSTNRVEAKKEVTLAVTNDHKYYVNGTEVTFDRIAPTLHRHFIGIEKPVVMLSMDKRLSVDDLTKVMNLAKENKFGIFLMTEGN